MKSKGAVKFFAIALAVVSIFQLSFTFVANSVENNAEEYANGDYNAYRRYLDSVQTAVVYNLGITEYTYQEVKARSLNLGLDLKGGMHVTLQVAMDQLLRELSGGNEDPTFNQALENARREIVTSQDNFIDLFYENIRELKPDVTLATYFATLENREDLSISSSNEDVLQYLREQSRSALERTYQVLRTRIDKFGVTQPNIQPDWENQRIVVEMPGVDDAERVRKLLKSSAQLEFYETYTLGEMIGFLQEADKAYLAIVEAEDGPDTTAGGAPKQSASDLLGLDNTDTTGTDTLENDLLAGTDTSTTAADSAARQTPLLSKLFPFQPTEDMAAGPFIGYVPLRDTGEVMRILSLPDVKDAFPPEVKFSWNAKTIEESDLLQLVSLRTTGLEGDEAVLYGDVITDARQDIDPQTNAYVVSMQMNPEGAADWAAITRRNIGKPVAIVLDGAVYSAPNVQNEITGGNSQITGDFNVEEAKDLANILKAGKLPVNLEIIDEAVVGPSLGQDAINDGLLSLILGVIAVILFMVLYYNRSGWVANLALIINLFFIVGVLASLQAALTLPGMAGIVLILGMAVDANVLIYERIREELGLGKGIRLAVAEGFKNALSSIIDGNLTTLIIGVILMTFGTGPIYGFAVVLVIGILTSLFTAILISRLIFEWLLDKEKKINFGNKVSNNFLTGINYDFVGKRRIAYWFSGTVIAIGIASLAFNGLNYGVDFQGGRSYVISFEQPVQLENVRSTLTTAFEGSVPEVKTFGSDNTLNILTNYKYNETGDEADKNVEEALTNGLNNLNTPYKIESHQIVGATVASDIKNSAFWSVIFGILAVFAYIVIRFKRWQFALGATLALAHDVFFVLSVFSIFKDILPFTSVDQAVVAGLLTIVGYSINDTVVVFDRIREYLRNNRSSAMIPTINAALNSTLSRTIITALTVFIVVVILFIFGGPIIRGFSFALLLGIVIGTYSSIFVATPIVIDLHKKKEIESVDY